MCVHVGVRVFVSVCVHVLMQVWGLPAVCRSAPAPGVTSLCLAQNSHHNNVSSFLFSSLALLSLFSNPMSSSICPWIISLLYSIHLVILLIISLHIFSDNLLVFQISQTVYHPIQIWGVLFSKPYKFQVIILLKSSRHSAGLCRK